jgi:hypothetical protein
MQTPINIYIKGQLGIRVAQEERCLLLGMLSRKAPWVWQLILHHLATICGRAACTAQQALSSAALQDVGGLIKLGEDVCIIGTTSQGMTTGDSGLVNYNIDPVICEI